MIEAETDERGRRLISALTSLINLAIKGAIPDYARDAFFGASLCALTKKSGGVRPIAVGSLYRRLAAKICAKFATAQLAGDLRPAQLGVGTPGGCEAAVHAARLFVHSPEHADVGSIRVLIKIDVKNAFNTLHRASFLQCIRDSCPQIYSLLRQAYCDVSPLYYGSTNIQSRTGLQQGDPLASVSFALAINSAVRGITCPFNTWFLDDGTLGGELELVLQNLASLQREFLAMGLELNPAKCELTILGAPSMAARRLALDRVRQVVPDILEVDLDNLTLLGAALGTSSLDSSMVVYAEVIRGICQRIGLLDAHWALFFLSRYVSAPRLSYAMRTSPLYSRAQQLQALDEVVRSTLCERVNVAVSGQAWKQAALPVRHGGLGIRSVSDLALPCFIASLHSCRDLVMEILQPSGLFSGIEYDHEAINLFQEEYPEHPLPTGDSANHQRAWDDVVCTDVVGELLTSANQVHRARVLAAGAPHSGAWLNSTPLPSLGLHLDDSSVQVAVSLRLGAPTCQRHRCRCGQLVDELGHHGLSCRYSGGRLPRHANLNDVVKRALGAAGIPSWLEPVGLDRGDGRRPDGVTIFPFSQGLSLCWDSTCVDTFCSSAVIDTALEPGAAAGRAEQRKRDRYRQLTDRYLFEPVAVETSGAIGPSTAQFLRKLGKRISARTGDKRETKWLMERISIAVVRGNAASIMASCRVQVQA